MQIVLASESPRRRTFLEALGFKLIVAASHVDETPMPEELAEDLVLRLAQKKAKAIYKDHENIVLAADTVVVLDNQIIGKPQNLNEARKILSLLSGHCHEVITGYALLKEDQCIQKVVRTKVWFRKLSDEEIENYISTKEPYDKSGAYAIQGGAAVFVDHIEGSFTNIIGLPVKEVLESLEEITQ